MYFFLLIILSLSCFFFSFWIIDLYFLITAVVAQISISTANLAIPTGGPNKDAKAEMETHLENRRS